MDLGNKHPLYDKLPYYWYYYGPYCELITESFNDFAKSSKDLFSLQGVKLNTEYEIIDEFPELMDLSENLLDKGNYIYKDLTEDIYKNYAPLDVIYPFKYGIFNQTQNDNLMISGDDFVKLFRQCQLKLIKLYDFMEFSRIFTGFTVELNILNDEHLIEHYWETIKNPIRNLWFTFAKGLRIQCHDFYYDNHCKNWKIHFNNSMDELDNQLFDFIDKFSNITYSKKIEYTESQKRILNSTIGAYLRDDYEG